MFFMYLAYLFCVLKPPPPRKLHGIDVPGIVDMFHQFCSRQLCRDSSPDLRVEEVGMNDLNFVGDDIL